MQEYEGRTSWGDHQPECKDTGTTVKTAARPKQVENFLGAVDSMLDIGYRDSVDSEEIILDKSPPPQIDLLRRGGDGGPLQAAKAQASASATSTSLGPMTTADMRPEFSSPATAVASTATGLSSIVAPEGDSTSSAAPAQTSIISAGGSSSSAPKAFDGGLGNNYTDSSCPLFLNSFLNNETFTDCMPFSLLLQTSMSFFAASKSASTVAKVLDSSCHVVVPACTSLMSSLAQQLKQDSNCGEDYRRQNPMVRQAYNGLVAYSPLYQASCMKNPKTNHYCFVDAVTNMSNPSDSYVYYLPLGMPLPSGSILTCSSCLKETMGIFNIAAGNKSQPVNTDYSAAAQMINLGCGPGFVNQTIPKGAAYGAGSASGKPSLVLSLSAAALVTWATLVQLS
ncbi:MAG: hypothetical protein Q9191_001413 [Dirinaria sp. TL-2023a]